MGMRCFLGFWFAQMDGVAISQKRAKFGEKDCEFGFGHVEFEIPLSYSKGFVRQANRDQ